MKRSEAYAPLAVFLILSGTGFIAYFFFAEFWELWMAADSATAVALSVLAFMGYMEYAKGFDRIKLVFEVDGERYDTKLRLLRKDCTRSEIMGVLGMVQKENTKRFEIAYVKNPRILDQIISLQKDRKIKEFVIKLTKDEAEQFHPDIFEVKGT
jgi:hypothetical protein